MRISRILSALLAMTMLCGVTNASPPPLDRPLVNMTWDMTPIDNALTSSQVEFLNLYMNYPDSSEMRKLSRHVTENLPVYIALHERQLDPKALIHFRVTQLLNVGMTFSDIATLQGIITGLQEGRQLDPKQKVFLKSFIADVGRNQRISLNPWFRPLFSYVANNPGEFTSKETNLLRDALLVSVGLTPRELNGLYKFADQKSNTPILDEKEVGPANKLILLAHLGEVGLLNPEKMSYLQFAINQNRAIFGPEKVEAFNRAVDSSRAVEQFKYEAFQANKPEMSTPQVRAQIENPQAQYLEQQRQMQAAQERQQQMQGQQRSPEGMAARQRYYEQQQAAMEQRAQQMTPQQIQQMQAYQRQAEQQQQRQATMQGAQ